ncbi:Hypothetical protein ABZS17H1_00408 [Kosakonia cowanii]
MAKIIVIWGVRVTPEPVCGEGRSGYSKGDARLVYAGYLRNQTGFRMSVDRKGGKQCPRLVQK